RSDSMSGRANDTRIVRVTGRGITIHGDDIDTDQILPARYLKAITFRGMEAHVFADARTAAKAQGQPHPLDQQRFSGGELLFVNRNFGCGSSREHAPQGLRRFGIKAVIGESFGEIFAGNCVAVGMPCVVASAETMAALQRLNETDPQTRFTLDLAALTMTAGDQVFPVTLAEGRRRQFTEGSWDPTSVLLAAGPAIEEKLAALPYIAR
ncbi:MAG TPA: 3-isopropylmalate dehydratase small subunit, partial [Acetobacteraceae bacterium]|nr:3-isopropylmalate dehydratase small subunit [Acetobacteraceae bacterium]